MSRFNIAIKGFDDRETRLIERMINVLSMQASHALEYCLIDDEVQTEVVDCFIINQNLQGEFISKIDSLRELGIKASFISIGHKYFEGCQCVQRPITVAKLKKVVQEVIIKHFDYIPELVISDDCTHSKLPKQAVLTHKVLNMTTRRAMVVDDSPAVLKNMQATLSLQDFHVDIVDNPNLTSDYLLRYNYNIIFLDIMMPFINGYDLAKEIRKSDKVTPIIMLTSKNSPLDKVKSSLVGANHFLNKPVSSQTLVKVLEKFNLNKITLHTKS